MDTTVKCCYSRMNFKRIPLSPQKRVRIGGLCWARAVAWVSVHVWYIPWSCEMHRITNSKKKNQTDKIQHIDIRSVFRKWKWVWIPRWFSCWSSPRVFSFPSTRLLLSTTSVVTTNVVHQEVEGDTRKLTTLVAVSRIISKQVKTLSATLRSLGDGIDSQVMLEAKCPYKWYREWDVEQYIQCGWMVPFLQELMELSTTRLASISSA